MKDYLAYLKSLDDETIKELINTFSSKENVEKIVSELSKEYEIRRYTKEEQEINERIGKFYKFTNTTTTYYYHVQSFSNEQRSYSCDMVSITEINDNETGVYSFSRKNLNNTMVPKRYIFKSVECSEADFYEAWGRSAVDYTTYVNDKLNDAYQNIKTKVQDKAQEVKTRLNERLTTEYPLSNPELKSMEDITEDFFNFLDGIFTKRNK